MLVKKLEDICHDLLLKNCNLDYFYKDGLIRDLRCIAR